MWTIFCLLVPFVLTEVSNGGGDGSVGRMGDNWWKNYELVEELLRGPDIETLEVDEMLVTTRPAPAPRRVATRLPPSIETEQASNTIRHLETSRATPRPVPVPVSVTRRATTTTTSTTPSTTTSSESTPFSDHTLPFTTNAASTTREEDEEVHKKPEKPHRGRLRLRIRRPSSAVPEAAESSEVKTVSSIRPPSSTQPSSFLPARDVRVFHRYSLLDTVKPNVLLTQDQTVSESSRPVNVEDRSPPRRRRIRKGKRVSQTTTETSETTDEGDLTALKRVAKRETIALSRTVRQSPAGAGPPPPMDPESISTQILSGVSPSRLSPQRANRDPSRPQADGDINTFVAAQILSGQIPTKDAHLPVEATTVDPENVTTTTAYPPLEELEAFITGQILSGSSKWMRKEIHQPTETPALQHDINQQILSGIKPGQSTLPPSTTAEPIPSSTTEAVIATTATTTTSTTTEPTTVEAVTPRKRLKVRRRTTTTTAAAIPEADVQEPATVTDEPPRRRLPLRARGRREASDSGVWFSDLGPDPAVITDNSDNGDKNKGIQKKVPTESSSLSAESSSGDDPVIKGPSTKQIQEATAAEPDSSGLWFGFMDEVATTTTGTATSKKPSSRSRMGLAVAEAVSRSEVVASTSSKRSTNLPPIPMTRGQKRRLAKNNTERFAALEREMNSVMMTTEKYPEENDEYLHGTKLASESSDVETTADVNSTSSFRISSSADGEQDPVVTSRHQDTTTRPLFRREEEKPRVREETIRLVSDRTKIAQAIAERARRRKGQQQRRPAVVAESEVPLQQEEQVGPAEQSEVFEDIVATTTTTERFTTTSPLPTVRVSATEILTRPPPPPPPPPPLLKTLYQLPQAVGMI